MNNIESPPADFLFRPTGFCGVGGSRTPEAQIFLAQSCTVPSDSSVFAAISLLDLFS